nr:hypothetical protein Iba_scaffold711947CG0010 [Ipomoea batatas]
MVRRKHKIKPEFVQDGNPRNVEIFICSSWEVSENIIVSIHSCINYPNHFLKLTAFLRCLRHQTCIPVWWRVPQSMNKSSRNELNLEKFKEQIIEEQDWFMKCFSLNSSHFLHLILTVTHSSHLPSILISHHKPKIFFVEMMKLQLHLFSCLL